MSLSKMSSLANVYGTWGPKDIGKHNIAEVKVDIQIALMLMKDSFRQVGTMHEYIMSDAELQLNPRYLNADGTFKERPGFPRELSFNCAIAK
jgi:NADPH-dependent 7-cyano-7-deazaguanine reductase QueF